MPLSQLVLPTLIQMLRALSAWLDKAEARFPGEGGERLLAARLAPDMFPLATQLRFACVQACEAVHRLAGEDFPPLVAQMLEEGRAAGEAPGTMAQARARIGQTLALVEAMPAARLDGDPQRPVAHAIPAGMVFDFTAQEYVRDWALPQFYFHLMAAYAILRGEGVDLGKADYIAHLLGRLRPGPAVTT